MWWGSGVTETSRGTPLGQGGMAVGRMRRSPRWAEGMDIDPGRETHGNQLKSKWGIVRCRVQNAKHWRLVLQDAVLQSVGSSS